MPRVFYAVFHTLAILACLTGCVDYDFGPVYVPPDSAGGFCYKTLANVACYQLPDAASYGARVPGWNGYVDSPAEISALSQ